MLSNHLHNGIQTAMVVWSRVPSSEEGEAAEVEFASRSHGGTDAESLDYELVENYAYRKEQAQRGKLCVSYYVVLKWLFSLVIGIVVTFGTAVPAGQFVPGIMIGLTYGRLVGMFVVKFYKKLNVEEGTQNFSDFVKTVSRKGLSIEDIHLTEDELELYLDLAPYLNPPPYIVPEDQSLAKEEGMDDGWTRLHVPTENHTIGQYVKCKLLKQQT
ncbi:chloride channel [Musa troglodytarum]|uniref:Chloride channel n=1 Tax=Musa troglodytarum TaxID=320322 RepID=A0A9E7H990_9LILI|nr:chloride channel [Musa troglodytarum]